MRGKKMNSKIQLFYKCALLTLTPVCLCYDKEEERDYQFARSKLPSMDWHTSEEDFFEVLA